MAVKKFKPVTAGTRHKIGGTFDEITTSVPEKSLLSVKKSSGGRNNTGKMTVQVENLNRYGFIVDVRANKLQIRNAVEQMYGAVVTDDNTINYMGKLKICYTKAGLLEGRANNFKKAIVTLKDGDKIDFYSNI